VSGRFSAGISSPRRRRGWNYANFFCVDYGTHNTPGDDWHALPNLQINFGLRYEVQNNIGDKRDWAPRLGLAWGPGGKANKAAKTVLRAGFGMFYDRFALGNTLTARRYNGIVQQQFVVTNPDFFGAIPPLSSLQGFESSQVTQKVDAQLRSPAVRVYRRASIVRQDYAGRYLHLFAWRA
jgi:hypothetical protein